MTPSPTAFLVLAHQWPEQLARLTRRLDVPWAQTFVHVDKKADITPFQKAVSKMAGCHFVPDSQRIKVYWGGFSQVLATIRLLRFALENLGDVKRLCLLSGVDYPIKPMDHISQILASDQEFISVDSELRPQGQTMSDRRAYTYSFGDNHFFNWRSERPEFVDALRLRSVITTLESMTWRRPFVLPIYKGSQWWCLTRNAIENILAEFDKNPARLQWFRYSSCSDEMVFQTFLKASNFENSIASDHTRKKQPDSTYYHTHCNYWDGPTATGPKILELSDLPRLRASTALFARKFSPSRSAVLMDMLDGLTNTEIDQNNTTAISP